MVSPLKWSDLELQEELGAGKAGVVWFARLRRPYLHLDEGTSVAVKRYKGWVIDEPGQFERIFRELEIGRKIVHPNLVKTLGVVADERTLPALVMQYYEGESLQNYLERNRNTRTPIDIENTFDILGGVAGALKALHDSGVIHRDVKPANILLTSNGPILMDLGVVASRDFAHQTTEGAFLGTIRYASPEYLFGESYDFKVDIYSLGAIAYELITGQEFTAEEDHWARLIARRRIEYEWSWNAEMQSSLEPRIGLNCLEFCVTILDHTLVELSKRNLDLGALSVAIQQRLWEKEFHIAAGAFLPGPPLFHPLGTFDRSMDEDVPIEEIVESLRRLLSSENRAKLRRLVHEHYWDTKWLTHGRLSRSTFEDAGAIRISAITEFELAEFHPAVKYAFRYGML